MKIFFQPAYAITTLHYNSIDLVNGTFCILSSYLSLNQFLKIKAICYCYSQYEKFESISTCTDLLYSEVQVHTGTNFYN